MLFVRADSSEWVSCALPTCPIRLIYFKRHRPTAAGRLLVLLEPGNLVYLDRRVDLRLCLSR